ncbi:hypothetical protein LFX25_07890 [Leptospira sp. FAT2]|uniref:MORN repeat-containing protein n=1 Tax=Leptospira sanjuanensis TaxID=2879643 RepID=UPI001EE82342|nr:hypothetical protein [Leptospira sanjuanensis]MCG6167744.1 hypothetical protein [Leptospira sanjuanensis]MCG6193161.1 hypothetical protein [Leptospira sanjuanensis]
MSVSENGFISYSKNMILLRSLQSFSVGNFDSKTLCLGVMFLITTVHCSYGDKKMAPNESASGAGRSAYYEDERPSEEDQPSSASNRSVTPENEPPSPTRGCIQGDCTNGTGTYVYDNDDEYRGSFTNDLRNGSGRIKYKNGDRFDGTFKDDVKDGKGTYIFKNGAMLEGNFQAGKMIGPGKVRFPDTSIYEGEFQDEKNSSEGILYSAFDHSRKHCRIENKVVLCGGPVAESSDIKPLH